MNTTDSAAAPAGAPRSVPWVHLAWFGALLAACYAPVLMRLGNDWIIDEDMGHGFFVPAVALYIAWLKKDEILGGSYKAFPLGLVVVALGGLQLMAATLGVELFLSRTAFIVSLGGIVLTMGGWKLLKDLSFPLFLLCFMVPLPAIIYNQITFPLQLLASQIAEHTLSAVGIPVLRDGNILELPSQRLSVVEACSGIRSLLSLTFLSLVYGYFFDNKTWMRWVLLVLTVPIALTANAFRVTITGILSEVNPELAQGLFHSLEGWVIFMIALAMLVAAHRIVNFVYARVAQRG
ncbi:MAG: exosortase [Candidatus Solibacter sp.]|nr:exosortase [Candidatus Solibacter sp.]